MNPLGRYGILAVILIGLFLLVGWKNSDPVYTQNIETLDSREQTVATRPAKPAKPVKPLQVNAYRLPTPTTLKEVQVRNRETLKNAPRWMDDDKIYEGAIFHYGLPGFARPWINLDVGEDPTIPDLLGFMLVNLKNEHVNYFEIGVSVGKCLFQMLEILGPASNVTAFDVEEINPSFAATLLNREDIKSWTAKSTMKPHGSFYRYNKGSSRPTFNYVSSDEFDQGGWLALVDQGLGPFDAIYSDAMHTPGALHDEWINIKDKNLLAITENRNWFMAWDDLGPVDMRNAVEGIMKEIREVAESRGLTAEYAFLKVNGWLGKNEGPHDVGVISNLPVRKLLQDAGFTLE